MTLPKDRLKKLKKQLKKFKKVAKSDMDEGLRLSEEISNETDELIVLHGNSFKEKELKLMHKMKEMLVMYQTQMNAVKEFKNKWD